MTWLRRIPRFLISLCLLGMIAVAAFGFFAMRSDIQTIQRLSMDRIEWRIAQIEAETEHFGQVLARYAADDPEVPHSAVAEAIETLDARLETHLAGESGSRIAGYDEGGVLQDIRDRLEGLRQQIGIGGRLDPEVALQLSGGIDEYALRIRALSQTVVWSEELLQHEIRADLRASTNITLGLSLISMALAAALVAALLSEVQRQKRQTRESRRQAALAEEASRAKSRFLSMMSHELRTPMNGVLGLVALVRQSGLTPEQAKLLDQAERSGREMINQLVDILDFAELEGQEADIEPNRFDLSDLADSVRDLYGHSAEREGIELDVRPPAMLPGRLLGDFVRIRQVIGHLVSFLTQRVAERDVTVEFAYAEGRVIVTLTVSEPPEGRPGWRADTVLGAGTGALGSIESDALGPAIARGLLARLGGTIDLEREDPRRPRVIVSIPVELAGEMQRFVRLEVNSPTMRTVCHSMLTRLGLLQWDRSHACQAVDAVVVEASEACDPEFLTTLRRSHPGARIVSIGNSQESPACDAAMPYPPTLVQLRDAIGSRAGMRR